MNPSSAQYMIRFDDICPTMNWRIWDQIERLLAKHDIKPILAVIPDNQDDALRMDPPAPDFWDRVRRWQSMGWSIGLHGFQHEYVNDSPGMLKLSHKSEFANLPKSEQKEKLSRATEIFKREGVVPDCWIAPSHSFDENTVSVLLEVGVKVISDGYWSLPHRDEAMMIWVPQQLWRLERRGAGIWTACYHHSVWKAEDQANFETQVTTYAAQMTTLKAAVEVGQTHSLSSYEKLEASARFFYERRCLDFIDRVRHPKR